MRIKLPLVVGAFALAALWLAPNATAQGQGVEPTWVWVCHNGRVLLVNQNSSHVEHGDLSASHTPGIPPNHGFVTACLEENS